MVFRKYPHPFILSAGLNPTPCLVNWIIAVAVAYLIAHLVGRVEATRVGAVLATVGVDWREARAPGTPLQVAVARCPAL